MQKTILASQTVLEYLGHHFCGMPMHQAYAKINLGLHITEKRTDGFHNIETVFHLIDLYDEIKFAAFKKIEVLTNNEDAPGGEQNLAYKAAAQLQKHAGISKGVKITIKKNIPVGAGLGGGSSDAATVLRELPEFWKCKVTEKDLQRIALSIGSDVPYFLKKGTALGRGRGEQLEYFSLRIPFTILVCNPVIQVSTAWAYENCVPTKRATDFKRILAEGMKTPSTLVEKLYNDLEPVVFPHHPSIAQIKKAMADSGALFALMSGSGSTVYGLFANPGRAEEVAGTFSKIGLATFITPPNFSPAD